PLPAHPAEPTGPRLFRFSPPPRRSRIRDAPFRSPCMTRLLLPLAAVALIPAVFTVPTPAADEPKPADTNIVFRNASLYDGTDKPGVKGDRDIKGDRIIAVGEVGKVDGATEVDATGLIICPGFIDLHTHCDTGNPALTAKAGRPNKNYVTQGVTTVITGNCGS